VSVDGKNTSLNLSVDDMNTTLNIRIFQRKVWKHHLPLP